MLKTLVSVIFPLHSSVFHYRIERFVKFDVVLHHDISCIKIKKSGPSSGSLHGKKCILLSVLVAHHT